MEPSLFSPAPVASSQASPALAGRNGTSAGHRLLYIDNLRWVMIILVVSMHAAVTYSHLGSWYYMENRPVSMPESAIFGTYQAFLQSFFMGFLFFIAGYFVPPAFDSKVPGKFLRDRSIRLGLPLLLFVFLLQPFSVWCISLFGGEDVGGNFAAVYRRYITQLRWMGGTGPLWFCEALLIFCGCYTVFRMIRKGERMTARHRLFKKPGRTMIWAWMALIGLLTFLVRLSWPNGTSFYNLQFCYFAQYVVFFIAGTMAYRGGWLQKLTRSDGRYWGLVGSIGGLIMWAAILAFGGAFKGDLAAYRGGLHWQSLAMACWEQVAGIGLSLFLLVWFRERFSGQGKWAKFFSANAFAVYVFHTPVLIILSRMMSGLSIPLIGLFLLLTMAGTGITYLLSGALLRKIPLLKNIL